MNEFGKILPSEFIPQFRDTMMNVKLEGSGKEFELPEIEDPEDLLDSQLGKRGEGSAEVQKKLLEM